MENQIWAKRVSIYIYSMIANLESGYMKYPIFNFLSNGTFLNVVMCIVEFVPPVTFMTQVVETHDMLQCIRDFRVYAYTLNVSGVRVHTNIFQCIRVSHSIWVVNRIRFLVYIIFLYTNCHQCYSLLQQLNLHSIYVVINSSF